MTEPKLLLALDLCREAAPLAARLWESLEPNCNAKAIAKYKESIQLASLQVEAYYHLALLLLQHATTKALLNEAISLLTTASDNYRKFAAVPLPWGSNPICKTQIDCGRRAQQRLALLLCQQSDDAEDEVVVDAEGNMVVANDEEDDAKRGDKVDNLTKRRELLNRMGYAYKLSDEILRYSYKDKENESTSSSSSFSSSTSMTADPDTPSSHLSLFRMLDSSLPAPLLAALQRAFAPTSPFWSAHAYGGDRGYFSYVYPLTLKPRTVLEQAIQRLHACACAVHPVAKEATVAEWWVHSRYHNYGHQLHFDSDDEGRNGIRHPCLGSILFVTGECGGPTLITNQVLRGPMADQGWLVEPSTNRYMVFDARYLHGVIPGAGVAPGGGKERRMTLMVAYWKEIKCRTRPTDGSLVSAMAWPSATTTSTSSASTSPTIMTSSATNNGALMSNEEEKHGEAGVPISSRPLPSDKDWISLFAPIPGLDGDDGNHDRRATATATTTDASAAATADALKALGVTEAQPHKVTSVWERCDGLPIEDLSDVPSYEKCFQGL